MAVAELGYKIDPKRDAKRAADDLDRLDGSAIKVDTSTQKMTKALGGAVGKMIALAAAAVSFGKIVSTLSNFEDGMARLGAITRATDKELSALRNTAKELGATTEFSASQAADGLTFLGQAGFSAAESMAAIPAVLDLATAAGLGLAQAADISSNIMSAFGIAAADAAQVADVLAAASSRANTDVSQLGDAMKFVGPVASSLGISMNDAAAAVGILSDAGIQGGMAGTSLRRVLTSLIAPTGAAADALKRMGVEAKDVSPATNDLADIVSTLAAAGLDAADAMTIFGDRGGPAILALTSKSGRLHGLTDALTDVGDEADRMATTMRGALGGSIKGLMSAVENLIITMGDAGLTAAIQGAVGAVTIALRVMAKFVENIDFLAVAIGGLALRQIPMLIVSLKSMVAWLTSAQTVLWASMIAAQALATALRAIPFVAAVVGVTSLIRGFKESAAAARDFTEATKGLVDQQENLSKATKAFYDEMTQASLDAMVMQAKRNKDAIETALAAADAELKAAGWYTRLFGVELLETERMNTARMAIDALNNNLIDAEARLSAADHAASNFTHTLSRTPDKISDADRATAAWESTMKGVKLELDLIASTISQLGGGAISAVAKQTEITALRAGKSIKQAAVEASEFRENLKVDAQVAELESRFGKVGTFIGGMVRGQVEFNRELDKTLEVERDMALEREKAAITSSGGSGGGGGGGGASVPETSPRIQSLIDSLATETEVLAAWHSQAQLDLILANDAELEAIGGRNEAKIRLEQEYQDRVAEIKKAETDFNIAQSDRTLGVYSNMMGSMAQLAKAGGDKTFAVWKAFSIAQATLDSYRAFTQVLADPFFIGRPYMRAIAAGAVLASGLAQVAAISSTSIGGGGGSKGSSGGGGGGGSASAPQEAASTEPAPRQRAIINITGGRSRFTIDEINDIIKGIQQETDDGVIIEGVQVA